MKQTERYLSEAEETKELEAHRLAGPITALLLLVAGVATELLSLFRV